MKNDLKTIINFIHKIGILKRTVRYSNNNLVTNKDTVASHSWRACTIGLLLEPYLKDHGLDSNRIIKMLLIHDLVEIESTAVESLGHRDRDAKKNKEEKIANEIFNGIKVNGISETNELLAEFVFQKSLEAKVAKAIENYESNMHVIEEVTPLTDSEHRTLTIDYISRRLGLIPVIDQIIQIQLDEIDRI